MACHTTDREGITVLNPTNEYLEALLESLDSDYDPAEVWLTHDSGWSLSVFPSGLVVFEDEGASEPRHLKNTTRAKALKLWLLLARGEIAAIEKEDWLEGDGCD